MRWRALVLAGIGSVAAAPALGDEAAVARRALAGLHEDMVRCFALYGINAEGLRRKNPKDAQIARTEAMLQVLLDAMAEVQKQTGMSDQDAHARIQAETKRQLEEIGESFDYAVLLDRYGALCRGLVEDSDARRRHWVELEAQRARAPAQAIVPPQAPPLADAAAIVHPLPMPPAAEPGAAAPAGVVLAAGGTPPAAPPPAAGPAAGVSPAQAMPAPPAAAVAPAAGPAPRPALDAGQVSAMMRRAEALVSIGDLSGARLFYERLALAGHKPAALMLARSYDAAWLRRQGVVGVPADAERAAYWYERAARLPD
jgi:hypothetical protein